METSHGNRGLVAGAVFTVLKHGHAQFVYRIRKIYLPRQGIGPLKYGWFRLAPFADGSRHFAGQGDPGLGQSLGPRRQYEQNTNETTDRTGDQPTVMDLPADWYT